MTDPALRDEAAGLLRDLIRVDTSNPPGRETPAAVVLRDYLEANGIACELVARDPERANLIARIPGSGDGPSLTLLGHTDVVPADAEDWQRPPFDGHLDENGYLWGRGSVDMKNETVTRAVTMAALAREGFQPRGDLLFVAECDEEAGSDPPVGLMWLVEERPDIRTDFAINEGGGDRVQLADGRIVVPINIGEKATLPALVTALGEAGHASTPTAGANAVPRLATLIGRLAGHRTARHRLPETVAMLEALVGSIDGDLDAAIQRATALHPSFPDMLPPLFAATIAPTRLRGSSARNVMPGRASVECDCRILPRTEPGDLEAELRSNRPAVLASQLAGVGKDAELQQVIDTVADAVRASGFVPRIASARDYHGLLWDNVELYLLGCSRGVVILEDRYLPELNPNVAMEWGWMRAATKPILVLAEEKFDKNRADFTGLIQYTFDWANPKPGISDAVTKFLSP